MFISCSTFPKLRSDLKRLKRRKCMKLFQNSLNVWRITTLVSMSLFFVVCVLVSKPYQRISSLDLSSAVRKIFKFQPERSTVKYSSFNDFDYTTFFNKKINKSYTWGYTQLNDSSISEHIFQLGTVLRDHVSVYKHLCIDTSSHQLLLSSGNTVCHGYNRHQSFFDTKCTDFQKHARMEQLFSINLNYTHPIYTDLKWFFNNRHRIKWVRGLTFFTKLPNGGINIAHFVGRLLYLFHTIQNFMTYSTPPRTPTNVFISADSQILERLINPKPFNMYHIDFLSAVLAPYKFSIGDMNSLITQIENQGTMFDRNPIFHVLSHRHSRNPIHNQRVPYLCFDKVIVTGLFKARFFINDFEYPSMKRSFQSPVKFGPHVPRDSLEFRKKIRSSVGGKYSLSFRKRQIVILHRSGSKRVFAHDSEKSFLEVVNKVGQVTNFDVKVTDAAQMDFKDQVTSLANVGIAIGIHGANLVNTIFMPPLSVLIEMFPYGFKHLMYGNGGNAGLKYMSYTVANGTRFPSKQEYKTIEECIRLNLSCKLHYRDSVLHLSEHDIQEVKSILLKATSWFDSVPQIATDF